MAVSTKLRLRRAWFQVHKWVGLLLFLILIPLSLSGSLLVWDEAADRVLNPQRHAVSPGPATLGIDRYVASARSVLASADRIASVALPDEAGEPVVVSASPPPPAGAAAPRRGPPQRMMVWIDPPTGRVLDHASNNSGLLRVLHGFHGSLLIPGLGRTIVGWLGVAMLLSALTGIWLWWPVTGSVRRGFRWKRGPLTSGNLHHQVGLWIAVPLAILSFTGIYISFPAVFGGAAGGPGMNAGMRPGGDPRRAQPLAATRMTPDAVVAVAGLPRLTQLRWPTDQSPNWTLAAGRRTVLIEDATGQRAPDGPARNGPGATAQLMRGLHDGHNYNLMWQMLIFLSGVAPAVLGITGVIMWLRTRTWRARATRRTATSL